MGSKSEFVFVGTGVSSAVPNLAHLLSKSCEICRNAAVNRDSKDHRNNVSALIRYRKPPVFSSSSNQPDSDSEFCHILIDVGKTFRDAVIKVFLPLNISKVDAILLTHGHADAMGGLDDVRDLQAWTIPTPEALLWTPIKKLPVYMSETTFKVVEKSFGYIVEAPRSPKPIPSKLKTAQLDIHIVKDDPNVTSFQPIVIEGLDITPLPVYHGGTYIAFGYAFGLSEQRVVYLSDVSEIPGSVLSYLLTQTIEILVLDCLYFTGRSHYSHFTMDQSLACVQRLQPRRAYFVGMFCEVPHDSTTTFLQEKLHSLREANPSTRIESIELAYDGLMLSVDL